MTKNKLPLPPNNSSKSPQTAETPGCLHHIWAKPSISNNSNRNKLNNSPKLSKINGFRECQKMWQSSSRSKSLNKLKITSQCVMTPTEDKPWMSAASSMATRSNASFQWSLKIHQEASFISVSGIEEPMAEDPSLPTSPKKNSWTMLQPCIKTMYRNCKMFTIETFNINVNNTLSRGSGSFENYEISVITFSV